MLARKPRESTKSPEQEYKRQSMGTHFSSQTQSKRWFPLVQVSNYNKLTFSFLRTLFYLASNIHMQKKLRANTLPLTSLKKLNKNKKQLVKSKTDASQKV